MADLDLLEVETWTTVGRCGEGWERGRKLLKGSRCSAVVDSGVGKKSRRGLGTLLT